jgi:hypothetical protein
LADQKKPLFHQALEKYGKLLAAILEVGPIVHTREGASMFKSKFIVAAAAALIGVVSQASIVFQSVNDTQLINYNEVFDGANLSATVQYTLTALGGPRGPNTATFHIVATNNTTVGQPGINRITSFGIGALTPSLTSIDSNSSVNWIANFGPTFPGFNQVGLCVFVGSLCGAGSSGGLAEGGDFVAFDIAVHVSNFIPAGIAFESPFVIEFQDAGTNGTSVEFAGCAASDASCQGTPPQDIPEPGSLALLGVAMLGSIVATRRPGCRSGH